MAEAATAERAAARGVSSAEKRVLALLGLPTFGLALGITAVTTYAPLLAKQFTASTTVIGVVIAAEGLVALVVPLVAGAWSDQLHTAVGGRLPFLVVGMPVLGAAMALLAFARSLWLLAVLVFVFFLAYYTAYEPYRAMYPDLLRPQIAGRGQSTQALFRGGGTGVALIGGGFLLAASPKLPFLLFAVLSFGAIAAFVWSVRGRRDVRQQEEREARSARETAKLIVRLVRERPALRAFLFANALWELSLAALKTFVVLFLTAGVGLTMSESTGVIAIVVLLVLIAAPISGKLGDRLGRARVVGVALWFYGLGLLVPFFTRSPWIALPIVPFVAFGGGMILTLPYAILMPLMPEHEHGLVTGFYSFSRGLGILLGPLLAGVAITAFRSVVPSTHGYAAMWLVCSAAVLASLMFMKPLRERESQLRRQRSERARRREAHGGAAA